MRETRDVRCNGGLTSEFRSVARGILAGLLFGLAAMTPALAQHAAHEHGKAELNIAMETEQELVVELLVPGESVYGFEHEPKNEAERKQQAEGMRRLETGLGNALVFDSSLDCRFESLGARDTESHDDHHDDHGDDHHDDHDDDHGHHDESEKSGHDHDEGHGHSDVHVQWSVKCGRSISGTTATFNWSSLLTGIEQVDVIVLSAERQDEIRLKGSSGTLQF